MSSRSYTNLACPPAKAIIYRTELQTFLLLILKTKQESYAYIFEVLDLTPLAFKLEFAGLVPDTFPISTGLYFLFILFKQRSVV